MKSYTGRCTGNLVVTTLVFCALGIHDYAACEMLLQDRILLELCKWLKRATWCSRASCVGQRSLDESGIHTIRSSSRAYVIELLMTSMALTPWSSPFSCG